jgi:transcriptional regulator with XRE-family HTH domain
MIPDLKKFRSVYQISQQQASEKIGIDRRQWSRYENGTNEMPIRYLYAICEAYGVSADFMLGLSDKREID